MSMGNIESYHQTVEEKVIEKVVGTKLFNGFKKLFDNETDEYSATAMSDALNDGKDGYNEGCCDFDQEDENWVKIREAYDKVVNTFKEKTGMNISLIYFSGDGDCYDDIEADTWNWEIPCSEVWVPKKLTKKALEFQKKYGNIDKDQRFSIYG